MEKPIFREWQVYREQGYYLRKLEQFEKAAVAFEEAFLNCQDDIRLLLGRSQVCAAAGMPHQAFEAAELALNLEPNNMSAIKVQARAMYTMTDFEQSIVMNTRGKRLRTQPPYFNDGIIQGLETLQDCVGVNAGKILQNNLSIIKQNQRLLGGQTVPYIDNHKCRIPKNVVKPRLSQTEKREFELRSRVMTMKYLGPMAADKFFLENLLADPRMKSANAARSKQLAETVEQAINKLAETQDMLRTQRPYYCIQETEKSKSRYLTNYRKVCLKQERHVALMYTERCLNEILKCLQKGRIKELMDKAERMQAFLNSKTPRILPEKNEYTDKLYKAVGKAYLSQYRVSYLSERHNRQRIIFLMGLTKRPKSYDSVIANYSFNVTGASAALEKMMNDLDICENGYMRCALLFKISKLLYSQKNYDRAKIYAKRCQKQAEELDSPVWWLNSCLILMSGEMQQGNAHEVELNVEESHDWIKKLPPLDAMRTQIRAFMAKVLEVIAETDLNEHNTDKERRKKILRVLDEQTKVQTGVLFKRMAAVPEGRRFGVVPEVYGPLKMTCERRRHRQPGISVVPGAPLVLKRLPKSEPKGYQTFKL